MVWNSHCRRHRHRHCHTATATTTSITITTTILSYCFPNCFFPSWLFARRAFTNVYLYVHVYLFVLFFCFSALCKRNTILWIFIFFSLSLSHSRLFSFFIIWVVLRSSFFFLHRSRCRCCWRRKSRFHCAFFFSSFSFHRAIIYWVYNSVMVLPSKKYKIDFTENSYRWIAQMPF